MSSQVMLESISFQFQAKEPGEPDINPGTYKL